MPRSCAHCSEPLDLLVTGRIPTYCSTRCRVAAHRAARRLPKALTSRPRWVRAIGKRPITTLGAPASSTDRDTWSTYTAVRRSAIGDGYGFMLGDGVGCYDLDHCLDGDRLVPWARRMLDTITEPILFVERSMSGAGLHVFVEAAQAPGCRRGDVERYSRARFIRVTGDRFVK